MSDDKKRVQFDFSPESLRRLDAMQQQIDVPTKAEVVRNALKVYEWLLQLDATCVIEVKDQQGDMVFRIPVGTLTKEG